MKEAGMSRSRSGKPCAKQARRQQSRQAGRRPWFSCPSPEQLEERILLATVRWINPGGGDWAAGANWSTGQPPGPSDDVGIDLAGNLVVTLSTGSDSIRSLTSQDALVLSGGTLSLGAPSQISNTFTLSGGTLTGAGDVTVAGPLAWTGGEMAGSGHTR